MTLRPAPLLLLPPLLALAACIPPAPQAAPGPAPSAVAQPQPAAAPAPAPLPPPPDNWADAPQTAGDWRWRQSGADSIADFVAPDGTLRFQMICTADGNIRLAVAGRPGSPEVMRIRTRSSDRAVGADAMESSMQARLDATDPLLDAMALSRGRFAVEAGGMVPLYLPSWPEVSRVIEDCRD